MNRAFLSLLMVVGMIGAASTQAVTWDGGGADDNWVTPENWDSDAIPGSSDWVGIAGGGTAFIDANSIDAKDLRLAWGGAGDGHLTIHSGSLTLSGGVGLGQGNASTTGQLTMHGGTLTMSSWGFNVGYQNATGILTLNDGLIDASAVPMHVGFGTWSAAEVTKGYVYLHGGVLSVGSVTLTDQSASAPGTQEGLIEIDGSGQMRVGGNVVDFLTDEINAGRIYGLNGQTVVAYYDADSEKTIVRISTGATDCAEAKVLSAAAGAPLIMDLDDDCYVGLLDLSILAADWWLRCYDPLDESCERPWDVVE